MADEQPPATEPDDEQRRRRQSAGLAMQNTPNAERFVLEADAMRRRQLRSALLHGSGRNWREHRRSWPSAVVGLIVVAVIIAGLAVFEAFQKTQENERENEQQQEQQSDTSTSQPLSSPSAGSPSARVP